MRIAVLLFTLTWLSGLSACTLSSEHREEDMLRSDAPLVIQPASMDMGEVIEGREATATLFLRNTGSLPVHVEKVESSCGCTTVRPDTMELVPGAFTPLHVRIDTTAKRGHIKKNITVFDSHGRKTQAWLTLNVKPNPHSGTMSGKGIFDGRCASCHFEPARGKVTGAAIYQAVCAMCHGDAGKGAYAPLLRGRNKIAISTVLKDGLGRQMPAFASINGGPLSRKQIANVAQWLSELDEQPR